MAAAPSEPRRALLGGIAVLALGLVLICLRSLAGEASTPSTPPPPAPTATAPMATRGVGEVLAERQRLDRTVWAKEVRAQEYEEPFIALWDGMRERVDDQHLLLAAFPFAELTVKDFGATRDIGWGLATAGGEGEARALDHAGWEALVAGLARDGYVLERSEWHHAAFDTAADGAARSDVSMKLLIANAARRQRLMVAGTIHVAWSAERDRQGRHQARAIDASDLTLTVHTGPEGFVEGWSVLSTALVGANRTIDPVLVYDLDRDGRDDLLLPAVNVALMNRGAPGAIAFAREPLCAQPVMPDPRGGGPSISAAALADVDGDGRADLVVAGPELPPTVFLAGADGRFTTGRPVSSLHSGDFRLPMAISVGDVDGDGRPDLWVGQYRTPYVDGNIPEKYWDADDGDPSFLLLNDGGGVFHDATAAAGLGAKRHRRNYSGSLVDLDGDGRLDLVTVNDFAGVDVFRNLGGKPGEARFADVSDAMLGERSTFGMSHAIADFDGDGALDLFVAGMGSTTARRLERMGLGRPEFPEQQRMRMKMAYGNRLFLGGERRWAQAPCNDQLARTGWSWGCAALDVANEGWPSLYIANGHLSRKTAKDYCTRYWTQDIYQGTSKPDPVLRQAVQAEHALGGGVSWNGFEHKALLKNDHGQAFRDVAYPMGLGFEWDGREVASADFDGDGRPDLVVLETRVATVDSPSGPTLTGWQALHVLRNQVESAPNHWLGARLREAPGHSPMGALITVTAGGRKQVAVIVTGDSYRCQQPLAKHFGLGPTASVDTLEVRWADGTRKVIEHPPIDHEIVVDP